LLPQGLETPDHHLFEMVAAEDPGIGVGEEANTDEAAKEVAAGVAEKRGANQRHDDSDDIELTGTGHDADSEKQAIAGQEETDQ